MPQNITFNGSVYTIPDVGDTDWGQNVTDYLVAIANGALQPTGGLFSLSADVDFGSNFGLESIYYKSRTADIAGSGVVRLARVDSVAWRNASNNGDLLLSVNALDQLTYNGIVIESDTLAPGNIFVGNASSSSTGVPMTGDIGINQTGLTSIQSGVIVNADVNASAAIALTKLAAMTASRMVVSDASGFLIPSGWGFLSGNLTTSIEGQLRLLDGTTNYISLKAPNAVTTYNLVMPPAQGAAGELLLNNGAGVLSWGVSTGMGTVNSGIAGRFSYYAANGTTLSDQTALTTDGSTWARFANGTIAVPSIGFQNAAGSGMSWDSAGSTSLRFSHLAVLRLAFDTTNGWNVATGEVGFKTSTGSAAAPSWSFAVGPTSGHYLVGSTPTESVGLSVRGVSQWISDSTQLAFNVNANPNGDLAAGLGLIGSRWTRLFVGPGTQANVAVSVAQANLGLYQIAADRLGITAGGTLALDMTSTRVEINNMPLWLQNGTVGNPSLANSTGTTTGLYWPTSTSIGISVSGSQIAVFNSAGLSMNSSKISNLANATNTGDALHFGQTQKIKQVVTGSTTTYTTSTSTSYVDTTLTATITPTSTTSKILVLVSQSFFRTDDGTTICAIHQSTDGVIAEFMAFFATTTVGFGSQGAFNYLDSPATTSARTYKTQMKNRVLAGLHWANGDGAFVSTNTITLIELEP